MATFFYKDPSSSEFWSERFEHQYTPWDKGAVPVALQKFVHDAGSAYKTLIPGCGAGYEVAYLSEHGWPVCAIDFSSVAVETARSRQKSWADRIWQADFFTWAPTELLEVIYERAFLCALPRRDWPEIVRRWAEWLVPGNQLIGFFYLDETVDLRYPKGPPFGMTRAEQDLLLTPYFEKVEESLVEDSVPVFAGKEYWQVWQRRIQKSL